MMQSLHLLAPRSKHHPLRRFYYWMDLYAYQKPDVPDHNKIMSTIVIFSFLVAHFVGRPFSVPTILTLGVLAFGPRMTSQYIRGREALTEQKARLSGGVMPTKDDNS